MQFGGRIRDAHLTAATYPAYMHRILCRHMPSMRSIRKVAQRISENIPLCIFGDPTVEDSSSRADWDGLFISVIMLEFVKQMQKFSLKDRQFQKRGAFLNGNYGRRV